MSGHHEQPGSGEAPKPTGDSDCGRVAAGGGPTVTARGSVAGAGVGDSSGATEGGFPAGDCLRGASSSAARSGIAAGVRLSGAVTGGPGEDSKQQFPRLPLDITATSRMRGGGSDYPSAAAPTQEEENQAEVDLHDNYDAYGLNQDQISDEMADEDPNAIQEYYPPTTVAQPDNYERQNEECNHHDCQGMPTDGCHHQQTCAEAFLNAVAPKIGGEGILDSFFESVGELILGRPQNGPHHHHEQQNQQQQTQHAANCVQYQAEQQTEAAPRVIHHIPIQQSNEPSQMPQPMAQHMIYDYAYQQQQQEQNAYMYPAGQQNQYDYPTQWDQMQQQQQNSPETAAQQAYMYALWEYEQGAAAAGQTGAQQQQPQQWANYPMQPQDRYTTKRQQQQVRPMMPSEWRRQQQMQQQQKQQQQSAATQAQQLVRTGERTGHEWDREERKMYRWYLDPNYPEFPWGKNKPPAAQQQGFDPSFLLDKLEPREQQPAIPTALVQQQQHREPVVEQVSVLQRASPYVETPRTPKVLTPQRPTSPQKLPTPVRTPTRMSPMMMVPEPRTPQTPHRPAPPPPVPAQIVELAGPMIGPSDADLAAYELGSDPMPGFPPTYSQPPSARALPGPRAMPQPRQIPGPIMSGPFTGPLPVTKMPVPPRILDPNMPSRDMPMKKWHVNPSMRPVNKQMEVPVARAMPPQNLPREFWRPQQQQEPQQPLTKTRPAGPGALRFEPKFYKEQHDYYKTKHVADKRTVPFPATDEKSSKRHHKKRESGGANRDRHVRDVQIVPDGTFQRRLKSGSWPPNNPPAPPAYYRKPMAVRAVPVAYQPYPSSAMPYPEQRAPVRVSPSVARMTPVPQQSMPPAGRYADSPYVQYGSQAAVLPPPPQAQQQQQYDMWVNQPQQPMPAPSPATTNTALYADNQGAKSGCSVPPLAFLDKGSLFERYSMPMERPQPQQQQQMAPMPSYPMQARTPMKPQVSPAKPSAVSMQQVTRPVMPPSANRTLQRQQQASVSVSNDTTMADAQSSLTETSTKQSRTETQTKEKGGWIKRIFGGADEMKEPQVAESSSDHTRKIPEDVESVRLKVGMCLECLINLKNCDIEDRLLVAQCRHVARGEKTNYVKKMKSKHKKGKEATTSHAVVKVEEIAEAESRMSEKTEVPSAISGRSHYVESRSSAVDQPTSTTNTLQCGRCHQQLQEKTMYEIVEPGAVRSVMSVTPTVSIVRANRRITPATDPWDFHNSMQDSCQVVVDRAMDTSGMTVHYHKPQYPPESKFVKPWQAYYVVPIVNEKTVDSRSQDEDVYEARPEDLTFGQSEDDGIKDPLQEAVRTEGGADKTLKKPKEVPSAVWESLHGNLLPSRSKAAAEAREDHMEAAFRVSMTPIEDDAYYPKDYTHGQEKSTPFNVSVSAAIDNIESRMRSAALDGEDLAHQFSRDSTGEGPDALPYLDASREEFEAWKNLWSNSTVTERHSMERSSHRLISSYDEFQPEIHRFIHRASNTTISHSSQGAAEAEVAEVIQEAYDAEMPPIQTDEFVPRSRGAGGEDRMRGGADKPTETGRAITVNVRPVTLQVHHSQPPSPALTDVNIVLSARESAQTFSGRVVDSCTSISDAEDERPSAASGVVLLPTVNDMPVSVPDSLAPGSPRVPYKMTSIPCPSGHRSHKPILLYTEESDNPTSHFAKVKIQSKDGSSGYVSWPVDAILDNVFALNSDCHQDCDSCSPSSTTSPSSGARERLIKSTYVPVPKRTQNKLAMAYNAAQGKEMTRILAEKQHCSAGIRDVPIFVDNRPLRKVAGDETWRKCNDCRIPLTMPSEARPGQVFRSSEPYYASQTPSDRMDYYVNSTTPSDRVDNYYYNIHGYNRQVAPSYQTPSPPEFQTFPKDTSGSSWLEVLQRKEEILRENTSTRQAPVVRPMVERDITFNDGGGVQFSDAMVKYNTYINEKQQELSIMDSSTTAALQMQQMASEQSSQDLNALQEYHRQQSLQHQQQPYFSVIQPEQSYETPYQLPSSSYQDQTVASYQTHHSPAIQNNIQWADIIAPGPADFVDQDKEQTEPKTEPSTTNTKKKRRFLGALISGLSKFGLASKEQPDELPVTSGGGTPTAERASHYTGPTPTDISFRDQTPLRVSPINQPTAEDFHEERIQLQTLEQWNQAAYPSQPGYYQQAGPNYNTSTSFMWSRESPAVPRPQQTSSATYRSLIPHETYSDDRYPALNRNNMYAGLSLSPNWANREADYYDVRMPKQALLGIEEDHLAPSHLPMIGTHLIKPRTLGRLAPFRIGVERNALNPCGPFGSELMVCCDRTGSPSDYSRTYSTCADSGMNTEDLSVYGYNTRSWETIAETCRSCADCSSDSSTTCSTSSSISRLSGGELNERKRSKSRGSRRSTSLERRQQPPVNPVQPTGSVPVVAPAGVEQPMMGNRAMTDMVSQNPSQVRTEEQDRDGYSSAGKSPPDRTLSELLDFAISEASEKKGYGKKGAQYKNFKDFMKASLKKPIKTPKRKRSKQSRKASGKPEEPSTSADLPVAPDVTPPVPDGILGEVALQEAFEYEADRPPWRGSATIVQARGMDKPKIPGSDTQAAVEIKILPAEEESEPQLFLPSLRNLTPPPPPKVVGGIQRAYDLVETAMDITGQTVMRGAATALFLSRPDIIASISEAAKSDFLTSPSIPPPSPMIQPHKEALMTKTAHFIAEALTGTASGAPAEGTAVGEADLGRTILSEDSTFIQRIYQSVMGQEESQGNQGELSEVTKRNLAAAEEIAQMITEGVKLEPTPEDEAIFEDQQQFLEEAETPLVEVDLDIDVDGPVAIEVDLEPESGLYSRASEMIDQGAAAFGEAEETLKRYIPPPEKVAGQWAEGRSVMRDAQEAITSAVTRRIERAADTIAGAAEYVIGTEGRDAVAEVEASANRLAETTVREGFHAIETATEEVFDTAADETRRMAVKVTGARPSSVDDFAAEIADYLKTAAKTMNEEEELIRSTRLPDHSAATELIESLFKYYTQADKLDEQVKVVLDSAVNAASRLSSEEYLKNTLGFSTDVLNYMIKLSRIEALKPPTDRKTSMSIFKEAFNHGVTKLVKTDPENQALTEARESLLNLNHEPEEVEEGFHLLTMNDTGMSDTELFVDPSTAVEELRRQDRELQKIKDIIANAAKLILNPINNTDTAKNLLRTALDSLKGQDGVVDIQHSVRRLLHSLELDSELLRQQMTHSFPEKEAPIPLDRPLTADEEIAKAVRATVPTKQVMELSQSAENVAKKGLKSVERFLPEPIRKQAEETLRVTSNAISTLALKHANTAIGQITHDLFTAPRTEATHNIVEEVPRNAEQTAGTSALEQIQQAATTLISDIAHNTGATDNVAEEAEIEIEGPQKPEAAPLTMAEALTGGPQREEEDSDELEDVPADDLEMKTRKTFDSVAALGQSVAAASRNKTKRRKSSSRRRRRSQSIDDQRVTTRSPSRKGSNAQMRLSFGPPPPTPMQVILEKTRPSEPPFNPCRGTEFSFMDELQHGMSELIPLVPDPKITDTSGCPDGESVEPYDISGNPSMSAHSGANQASGILSMLLPSSLTGSAEPETSESSRRSSSRSRSHRGSKHKRRSTKRN